MTTEVTYPDGEIQSVDWLTEALPSRFTGDDDRFDGTTVGIDLPGEWTTASPPHVMVALDGTPSAAHPIEAYQTIRLTAFALKKTDAKRLCAIAHGTLLAHPGGNGVGRVEYLTGVQPATDPTTGAAIAACTSRVTVRSQPV